MLILQIAGFGITTNTLLPKAEAVPSWQVIYTADDLPENSGFPFFTPVAFWSGGCTHRDIHSGGVYHYDSTVSGGCLQSASWGANAAVGFTAEARIQLISNTNPSSPTVSGVGIWAEDGTQEALLLVLPDRIRDYFSGAEFLMDTVSTFHNYRITVVGNTYKFYVDGVERLTGNTVAAQDGNVLLFGDGTSGAGSDVLWDCVSYTTAGAFSPSELPSPSCTTPSCTSPPSGMVSWWDGDAVSGTTASDIQDGNDGTLVGGAATAPGKVGQAFSFDGVDDYLDIGNPSNLNIVGDMTIDFWFRINSQKYNVLAAKGIGLDGNEWYVRQGGAFGAGLEFAFQDTDLDLVTATSSSPIITGIFYHLALVRDGTTGRLYLNGIQVASDTNPALGDISNPHNIFIGADNRLRSALPSPFVNDFAAVTIDEVEIYSRSLSASEIQAIFAADIAGKCKTISVDIDIKPGSFPNSINPKSNGVIPVAILTTSSFDASTVDASTVKFGPNNAPAVRSSMQDVDGDGDLDMILFFNTQQTGIACGQTSATLKGQTAAGIPIEGSDSIKTVPCK